MPNRSILVAAPAIAWLVAPAGAAADCEPVGPVAEVLESSGPPLPFVLLGLVASAIVAVSRLGFRRRAA